MEALVILGLALYISTVMGTTPEGCSEGWMYFSQLCYRYSPHTVDAIAAKDICTSQGASLTSIWNDEEKLFLINTLLPQGQGSVWTGLVPNSNKGKKWAWLDGSIADIHTDGNTPNPSSDICGAMNNEGNLIFKDCWEKLPGFICKKSLEMTYVVSDLFNSPYTVPVDPPKLLFERLWPPKLQDFPKYAKHIAHTRVSYVSHETDCAYYCSHVTNCSAFTIHCSLPWKCNQYACDLYQSK